MELSLASGALTRHPYETAGVTNFYHFTCWQDGMLYQIENATVNFRSVQRESVSDEVFRVTARAPLK